jgi:hypothetical protein
MDSTEIPVYGEQEQSAYNGHFESTRFHPLLLFNREGDWLATKLRPGNVHSAEGREELSEKAGLGCRADEFLGAGKDHSEPWREKQRWKGSVGGKWMYMTAGGPKN